MVLFLQPVIVNVNLQNYNTDVLSATMTLHINRNI